MRKITAFLTSVVLALSLAGSMALPISAKEQSKSSELEPMEVHFIDVGQGDATLIKCGESAMLIDAGENDKGTLVQNYLKKQGVKSLDYLIITHPDSDHSGGADVIITKYDIDTIIYPNYSKDTATWRDVTKAMDYKRYKVTEPVVGDTYSLGDAGFTIIAPNANDYGDNANDYSVGIILQHGNKKFVFTGDAEEAAESDIVKNKIDIKADVLQVGHHGSRTASTSEFLKAVDPEYAVISCEEDNSYGHPHAATLNSLRSMGVKVYRTDEQGSLVATSDGNKITWNAAPSDTWKAGEPNGSSDTSKTGVTSSSKTSNSQKSTQAVEEPKKEAKQDTQSISYVLNTKTKKFHKPSCGSLPTKNRKDTNMSRDEVIAQGYDPCKKCNP